ncbi:MAG: LysM peptidoglycan-binding domain-containing protein [Reichenbachiella sp.]|uniref:LysM peptidoglycan-binding domain-containing protein n=1 Tax=Reichenbachiella sp. TaxID=2184521 RepID=UPI003267AB6D
MMFRLLLFTIVMSFAQLVYSINPTDSLRTEKVKGKKFIIHRAEPKETLYSIARRYGVTIEDLHKQNTSLKDGLKMYDEIRIPLVKKKRKVEPKIESVVSDNFHLVRQGETLFAISRLYGLPLDSLVALNDLKNMTLSIGDTLLVKSGTIQDNAVDQASKITKHHVVKPSETLFGISKMYQVEIEDLQQWNWLSNFSLSIGQKLIVSGESEIYRDSLSVKSVEKVVIDSVRPKTPEVPKLDTLYVRTDNSQFKTKTNEVEGGKQTIEEGFVMKIEDTDYTKKFLALHRTAPLGSTIQVKNQMTNQSIKARVVGKLPESAMNRTLLMRLSSAAYKALGARDLKTPVTVSYLENE